MTIYFDRSKICEKIQKSLHFPIDIGYAACYNTFNN